MIMSAVLPFRWVSATPPRIHLSTEAVGSGPLHLTRSLGVKRVRPLLTISTLLLALAGGLAAQEERATLGAGVDSLLTTLRVADVLVHLPGAVTGQLEQMASDLPPEEKARTRAVVERYFAYDALYEGIVSNLTDEAEQSTVDELLVLLTTGAVSEARRRADEYQPPLSLEAFMERVAADPLPQARVELVSRLTRAQGIGYFYVMLAETTRGAVHTVLGAVVSELPRFRGLGEDEVMVALDASYSQAMITFLYRFEGVSDALLTTVRGCLRARRRRRAASDLPRRQTGFQVPARFAQVPSPPGLALLRVIGCPTTSSNLPQRERGSHHGSADSCVQGLGEILGQQERGGSNS